MKLAMLLRVLNSKAFDVLPQKSSFIYVVYVWHKIQSREGQSHVWTFPSVLVLFYFLQTFESNGKLNQVSLIIYSLQDPHKILAGSLRIFSTTFAKWRSSKILIIKDPHHQRSFPGLCRSLKILDDPQRSSEVFHQGSDSNRGLLKWGNVP